MPTRKNKNITQIVNRVNKSSANFVNRLKDPNRLSILDWEDSRYIATHKLGVGTDEHGNNYIYPEVQEINGKLIDFTRPPYHPFAGQISAEERRDTVRVNSVEDGLLFTENYKNYYPKGKTFKCGGRKKALLGLEDGVPTQKEYIAQQIAAKRAAALDKSRNRTSVRVPMVLNNKSEEEWRNEINLAISHAKRWIGHANAVGDTTDLKLYQDFLDKKIEESNKGYTGLTKGPNCIYNAGDCYGLNIPGNQTFAAKHKEKGFKRVDSYNMEPGDIVQVVNYNKTPVHAMIFDSKDKNGKPLYNYAKGSHSGDFNRDYVKQGRYPMEYNPLVYRYVGTPADSTQWINEYKQKYGNGMRCGGRRKAQLGLDVQYGGRAIPIGRNMVYFDGNSHEMGGIGVGNDLEVEGGEVGEYKNNTLRVFSSVPFLRGVSPAQLVMGGANPNKVFKAQEDFKDRNRINDDGTHYQNGGQTKSNSAIRTEADKKVPARNRAIYSAVDATSDYPKWWQAVGLGIGSNFKTIINPDSMNYTVTDSVADAAWRKRLGLSYDDKFLIPNKDGSVRLPRNVEMEIPTDTTILKKRIAANEKFANQSNIVGEDWQIVQAMMKKDKEALEALRKTYKTGEPVVVNEYAHNNRKLSKNGELIDDAINYKSPLNVMRNYTIQYDPKTRRMNYWDTYDFNEFEWGVPGKPFEIKGSIPLKRYGGNMIYSINGNVKNGLMSARPKAQYGKEKKINANTKIGEDGLIYTKAIDGDWYTDGTRYEDSKYYMGRKSAQAYSREKFKRQPKPQSLDEVVITGTRPKAKEESKPITTSSNNGNTITTKTIEGKQVDYPKTKTGYKPFTYKKDKDGKLVKVYDDDKRYNNSYIRPNREGANYKPNKYNPLTGETVDEQGIVKTSEPSINGTTKVSSSTSSTPRGRGTKSSKSTTSTKPAAVEAKQPILVERPKENLYITGIKNNAVKSPLMSGMEKISANRGSSSTGGGTQPKDGNWVPQYNLITGRDWLGVGTNLAGHIASYFANRDILDKYPMPTKPVMTPTVKLKTRVNINPDLTNSKEAELMGIQATNRNTSSSNTTLARNQRIMNENRDARNKLYAYKENAETQLINQDRLNRQGVYARNVAAYNDWLNKTYVAKTNKLLSRQQNLMSLINGIPMAVNNVLGNIETRKSTNDMIRAIAATNPNVDGRLLDIGDYYTQKLANGKIAKYNKNHKFIKYV